MKKWLIYWFAIVCGSIPSCNTMGNPKVIEINQSAQLTATEIASLKQSAVRGDGAAAYRLSNYYAFIMNDEKNSHRWLERAAQLEYVPAMKSLANMLLDSSRPQDRARRELLLRRIRTKEHSARRSSG